MADLRRHLQLNGGRLRFDIMNSTKLQERLDHAGAQAAGARDATARQAAYIEALARDGHDAATARKLLRAFEEMEALHRTGGISRPAGMPG